MSVECWTGKTEWTIERYGWASSEHIACLQEEHDSTRMLADGHDGDHVWTPDNQITVAFMPSLDKPAEQAQ